MIVNLHPYNADANPKPRYWAMRDALNATGRAIFFSMCEWGVQNPATWWDDGASLTLA